MHSCATLLAAPTLAVSLILSGAGSPAGHDATSPRGTSPKGTTTQAMSPRGTSPPSPATAAASRWQPPVTPLRMVRPFDPPARNWLSGHRGIDLRAEPGQQVRSAGAGRVTFAAELAGRGVVVVDHGSVRTSYEPVEAAVVVGEQVTAGEPIGSVSTGTGHCGDGSCLHLGLRRGSTYLNPLLVFGDAHARLIPW